MDIIIHRNDLSKFVQFTPYHTFHWEARGEWMYIDLQTPLGGFRFEVAEPLTSEEQATLCRFLESNVQRSPEKN